MLPVSLDCPFSLFLWYSLTFICPVPCVPYIASFSGLSFFIAPSVFLNIYLSSVPYVTSFSGLYFFIAPLVFSNIYLSCVSCTLSQLAHYVITTFQFGSCLVKSLSYVKIALPQRIFDTLYASRCDNVFSNVFVTYGYGLDVNVKAQT